MFAKMGLKACKNETRKLCIGLVGEILIENRKHAKNTYFYQINMLFFKHVRDLNSIKLEYAHFYYFSWWENHTSSMPRTILWTDYSLVYFNPIQNLGTKGIYDLL